MATAETPPTTRTIDVKSLVLSRDKDYYKPQPAYEFSNGRKFEDSGSNHGIYTQADE